MKILILGGTGAMGNYLVQILTHNSENKIYVTSRKQRPSSNNLTYIKGNALDYNFISNILQQNWDVIIDFMTYRTEDFYNRAELYLKKCKHYIFLSSSRVYGNITRPITENDGRLLDIINDKQYLSTDEYALAKARQENYLHQSLHKNWTIIRPYITYSDNRLQLGSWEIKDWLYRALLGSTIVFSEDIGNCYTTLTWGYNVAEGIASILNNDKAKGKTFHITSPYQIKWSEVLSIYLDTIEATTGHRPKVKLTKKHPYIKDKRKKYQIIYDRLYNRSFNNNAIQEFIDTTHFTPPQKGLKKVLSEFIKNNLQSSFHLNAEHEAKMDRITKERINLNYFDNKGKIQYICIRYFPLLYKFITTLKPIFK